MNLAILSEKRAAFSILTTNARFVARNEIYGKEIAEQKVESNVSVKYAINKCFDEFAYFYEYLMEATI